MICGELRVEWVWRSAKLVESWLRPCSPSLSIGLNRLDGALAMTSRNLHFKPVRFLIEMGADPSVHWWLPMRMVSAAGDVKLLRHLLDLSPPTPEAIEDARFYAEYEHRISFMQELAMARPRWEREELNSCTSDKPTAVSTIRRL